jgi:glyoxylase-like metal-dependent hydrolase (beta-lactamase superfamily II)
MIPSPTGAARRFTVTGVAQWQAWQATEPPPVERVAAGVWSIPVVIPDNPLRYVLCYALDSPAGPVLVDPGWPADASWAQLTAGLARAGYSPEDVSGVLVTHAHSDHHGLATRLRERSGCWIGMHELEAAALRRLRDGSEVEHRNGPWQRLCGVPESERAALAMDGNRMRTVADLVPDRFIADGDSDLVPGRRVEAWWTPGHTPGHLSFRMPDDNLLLTGDHLLPRITSNVSTYDVSGPDELRRYLNSLADVSDWAQDRDPEVLPGHEYRFRGVGERVAAVLEHHDERSAEILAALQDLGLATVWEVAARISWSRSWEQTTGGRRRLALAETLSHLRHLERTNRLTATPGPPTRWATAAFSCEEGTP